MENKSKIDRLHDLLPKYLNSKVNVNWSGLVGAIGDADQTTSNLIEEVKKQFFVKTAYRPYLDRLAANHKISRPRLVGMSDESFREYIPILSYKPKQVKLIIDALLDIFFFKESTTAFMMSQDFEPFTLIDGWELTYRVDNLNDENIVFNGADFTNIASATADEIAAVINRQTKHSYATSYYDSITKKTYIRFFTKTIGSKGSLEIIGGRANIALRLNGFIDDSGNGANTQWTITKIGDLTTFEHTGGAIPGLIFLQEDDLLISDLLGNEGSFVIESIDISNNSFSFRNLFSTTGVFTQTSADQTKFLRPEKLVCYKRPKRAVTWETQLGEFVVEMPTTPPVVKRSLQGSTHLNGELSLMTSRNSNTSLTVESAVGFPKSGSFILEEVNAITSRIITTAVDEVVTTTFNGRLIYNVPKYEYSSRIVLSTVGNSAEGSDEIVVASVAGLINGMTIFMDGFREDAVITDIVGLIVTSSIPSTVTDVSATVEFGGNTLTGITPNLPAAVSSNQQTLTALSRSSNIVTATTTSAHGYLVDEFVIISDSSGINILSTTGNISTSSNMILSLASTTNVAPGQLVFGTGIPSGTKVVSVVSPTQVQISANATATTVGVALLFNEDVNGTFTITSILSTTQFTYGLNGTNGAAVTSGVSRVERIAMAGSASKVIITDAQSADDTRIYGPYLWDSTAPFVLSSNTGAIEEEVQAGTIMRLLDLSSDNTIPSTAGLVVIDYGKNNQEGPIRYLYKPSDNIIALDPSYVFQKTHEIGASITMINHKGPHIMNGTENAPYVIDPSEARLVLEELIRSVKSAGIFVEFLIRYPDQLFGVLDVYHRELG